MLDRSHLTLAQKIEQERLAKAAHWQLVEAMGAGTPQAIALAARILEARQAEEGKIRVPVATLKILMELA